MGTPVMRSSRAAAATLWQPSFVRPFEQVRATMPVMTPPFVVRLLPSPAAAAARFLAGFIGVGVAGFWLVGSASAHGVAPTEQPSAGSLLLGWTFPPLPTLGIVLMTVWWLWAVRRVDAAHPANPVPRQRTAAFLLGMLALAFAVASGIERYDTSLFSVHMVQHVLLM